MGITIVIFALWQIWIESSHAKLIVGSTNTLLRAVGSERYFEFEKTKDASLFWVHTIVEGRKAKFSQKIGSLLQPTVMILAWQLFLFLAINKRKALRLLIINLGIFSLLQIIFLLQLMGYHTSPIQKFIYEFFVSSFYVIALIFVIKDHFFYNVFGMQVSTETDRVKQ